MCHLPTDLAAICMRCAMYSAVLLAPVGCHCSFKYLSLKQSGRWSSRCLLYQRETTFICSSPKLFFCVQVPSAAITTPAESEYAPAPPQMQEAKTRVAFGTQGCCIWPLLLDERVCSPRWVHRAVPSLGGP